MSVTINQGTQTAIRTTTVSAAEVQHVRPEGGTIDAGTVVVTAGTIVGGTVQNLVGGTINALASGTITGGTLQNLVGGTLGQVTTVSNLTTGTVNINSTPVSIGTSYGTLGTAGAATWGTLVAASGAGTYQYVSGVAMVVASGTVDCAITNVGTVAAANGAGILARGQFVPSGGMVRDFIPVMRSGTNGTLAYWLGGAGTVYFTVNYWQGV